jgi:hypothetical protein
VGFRKLQDGPLPLGIFSLGVKREKKTRFAHQKLKLKRENFMSKLKHQVGPMPLGIFC